MKTIIQKLQKQRFKPVSHYEDSRQFNNDREAGFTIIESLVAILVVAILMIGIAPVIAISVATRVQARRVELATQAARTYIDGVRAGTIPAPNYAVTLNETTASTSNGATTYTFNSKRTTFVNSVNAPTIPISCSSITTSNPYCVNSSTSSLYCVDRDSSLCANTSLQDMVIQAFRTQASTTSTTDQGYVLAIRVYRADAFKTGNQLKAIKDTTSSTITYKANPFAGGVGDTTSPLVELTTEITTQNTQFQDYCTRFGGCS